MIPSVIAAQFREGLTDYVETTFPVTTPVFQGSVRRFLEKKNAFFHEPYISVKLPFRIAEHGNERFEAIHADYAPYVHQNRAYDRLCGDDGQSTLVATGTGSGKTECFLYPILEYCYRHRGERGIKALVIYPMNALATDQALRIAKLIDGSPELRGNITAGMYVGDASDRESKTMQPDRIITDHETLQQSPPDILLTNYKMLDYLLVRPKDAALWSRNDDPETLRYVVVDELHTFDGAQGTDLACLLRRLKSRLMIQPGYLCCVGTSATMGGKESAEDMLDYASKVFGEPFDKEAIVTEDRISTREFFSGQDVNHFKLPESQEVSMLRHLAAAEDENAYISHAISSWFQSDERPENTSTDESKVLLARLLMHHSFFQSMISAMDGKVMQAEQLCEQLAKVFPEMDSVVLDSMLALISHARVIDGSGHLRPFLQVQIQLWMRELRRVLGKVDAKQSDLMLETDLNRAKANEREHYLPVINCRDCGATGWAGLMNERSQIGIPDIKVFYNLFFSFDKRVRLVFPRRETEESSLHHDKMRFCAGCLALQVEREGPNKCGSCGKETMPAWMPDLGVSKQAKSYICPFCGGTHSMILVGLRSATAISAGISQLYTSRFNDDKKLLAFSDNVQDAAHRASFFNARTWRFTLRAAIQQFVRDGGEGLSMDEFGDELNRYWRQKLSDEEYVERFIPHNMADNIAYETLEKEDKFPSETAKNYLLNDIQRRVAYEALLEYGIRSRIGRTLEKSCSSMIAPRLEVLSVIANAALVRIENEAGIRDLGREQLHGYLIAWMHHMRQNGAFSMPVYTSFVSSGGNSFLLTTRHIPWISESYDQPLFPALQTVGNGTGSFEYLSDRSWYVQKFCHLIGKTLIECPGTLQGIGILIDEMIAHKALIRMEGPKGLPVLGLSPKLFTVTSETCVVRCNVCGNTQTVPQNEQARWISLPCMRLECAGHYQSHDQAKDYFSSLYERGEIVRIHAREHTGLLKREDREKLEIAFKRKKHERKAWDPNLLSCTPTLEMGIDIGDLSTVVLCSIPPAQAQYLQRIGRAGRTDGNAVTVSVAGSRPHDLYFYQEPLEMIAGKVDPPGVFLNASAVLERQFVAYCFDCWVKSGIQDIAIPYRVKGVLSKIKQNPPPGDVFPFSFLGFITQNLSRLNRTFIQMFAGQLSEDSKKRIWRFSKGEGLANDSLSGRIIGAFNELHEQREVFRRDIKKLTKAIDELSKRPIDQSFDSEMRELNSERAGLSNVQKTLEEKNTFNFLSDEGLLPNYAFPEAGIILKALLTRKVKYTSSRPADDGKHSYKSVTFEYNRSASSAISEFAPDNSFYADGHKMKIDQVDVSTTEPEPWRLCPNCNHAAPASSLHDVASCPYCGSLTWADQGQLRMMLKVRTVYSTMSYEDSRSGDESDERANKFYSRELLVDINEKSDISSGYQTTSGELPFGYEFVSKATLREINFGESDNIGAHLTVAGKDDVRNGFRICKYCGKIQSRSLNAKPIHSKVCRAATRNFSDPFEECMFLYREFTSEAIRILVPATSMDSTTTRMESFAAAIMIGLKKYFGSVDHLRYTMMEAPVPDSEIRKQYMVIYDSVPGGTGYLKELMNTPSALMDVFELALHSMEHCTCASDPDKDGCYHCLFAYRVSSKINNISRRCAVDLLRKILAGKDSLEKIDGIASIPVNTLIGSELERRFIEALEQSSSEDRKVEITKSLVNGKEGYFLQIGSCCWDVELQVLFGSAQYVEVPSKPDFIFWPKTTGSSQRPVAVFTDGFLYHKNIVAEDSNKRMAIRKACRYPVWSLTWKDVQERQGNKGKIQIDTLNPEKMASKQMYVGTLQKKSLPSWDMKTMSSFDLLLTYLSTPNADSIFEGQAQALALSMLEPKKRNEEEEWNQWISGFQPITEWLDGVQAPAFKETVFGIRRPVESLSIHVGLPLSASQDKLTEECAAVIRFDDRKEEKDTAFEQAWGEFLYCTNVMQFLPKNALITERGVAEVFYSWMAGSEAELTVSVTTDTNSDWDDVWHLIVDPAAISLALQLRQANLPVPSTFAFELDGLAEAEMAWEDKKIAVLLPVQEEFRPLFESRGWRVFSVDTLDIMTALREG